MAKKKKKAEPTHYKITFQNGDSIEVKGSGEFVSAHMPYLNGILKSYFNDWLIAELKVRPWAEVQKDMDRMLGKAMAAFRKIEKGSRNASVVISSK